MTASPTDNAASDASLHEPGVTRWTYWPATTSPVMTLILLLAIPVAGVAAGLRVGGVGSGVLAALLLAAALINYLAPIRYTLSSRGITIQGLGSPNLIRWSRIESARLSKDHAVLLVVPEDGSPPARLRVEYGPDAQTSVRALRQCLLDAGAPLM